MTCERGRPARGKPRISTTAAYFPKRHFDYFTGALPFVAFRRRGRLRLPVTRFRVTGVFILGGRRRKCGSHVSRVARGKP